MIRNAKRGDRVMIAAGAKVAHLSPASSRPGTLGSVCGLIRDGREVLVVLKLDRARSHLTVVRPADLERAP